MPSSRSLRRVSKQDLYLLRGQNAGGFVHDQQLGVLQQAADDLDPLTFPGRQIADGAERIQRQAVFLAHLADPGGQIAERRRVLHAERDVLRHVQRVEQRKMLKHHGHAGGAGGARFGRSKGGPVHFQTAAVGLHQPIDHFHQRRLAGAVFPQQGMNFAGADFERHIVIGDDPGISLGQPADFQQWSRHAVVSPCHAAQFLPCSSGFGL